MDVCLDIFFSIFFSSLFKRANDLPAAGGVCKTLWPQKMQRKTTTTTTKTKSIRTILQI